MTLNNVQEDQNPESVVEVELETVVEKAMDEFDHVASITVNHLYTCERPTSIEVRVYTGESNGLEDYLGLFTEDHRIPIDRDDETLLIPFSVCATFDGPVTWDSAVQTTIYMNQNVLGSKPVQVEDGLAYVRDKLENPEQWDQDPEHRISLERIRNYTG